MIYYLPAFRTSATNTGKTRTITCLSPVVSRNIVSFYWNLGMRNETNKEHIPQYMVTSMMTWV